jgi:transcriptional regulator SbtR-like protein
MHRLRAVQVDRGGPVIDAAGGVMGLARRDVPGRVDHHEVGDRARQGAAEHPVAGREPGRPVTDLVPAILDAGRAAGDLRPDVTAEDIAAALIGIFTVAPRPERDASASRLLNLLMDGLRPPPRRTRPA